MLDNEKLKEKYMEYQLLMQQFQQLQENSGALEKHVMELNSLNENIDAISNIETDKETLIPLGSGIFLKGSLKDNSEIIMNVGANVCVEKNISEAKETVSNQINEISEVLEQLQNELVKTVSRLQELQNEFQKLKGNNVSG